METLQDAGGVWRQTDGNVHGDRDPKHQFDPTKSSMDEATLHEEC